MDKQQSQAFAAVICRAIDYYHTRARAEQIPTSHVEASYMIDQLEQAEVNIAHALETLDEDESGEAHQVG